MKDNDFLYVKEIAKEKSFSLAAKKLGISQPALSAFVNKLEKKIGVQLFDRSISPIELTEYGKYYLEYADFVLEASEKFKNIVSDLSDLKQGTISIGSTACFSMGFLPKAVSAFHKKYNGINFDIIEGKVSEMQERCLDGDVDMVFSDAHVNDELFDKEVLFEERIVLSVPPEAEINKKIEKFAIPAEEIMNGKLNSSEYKDLDLNLLKDEKFLLLNDDQAIRRMADNLFEESGFIPKEIMQVPQTTTGLAMTIAGLGSSFVAESTIKYSNLDKHPVYYRVGTKEGTSREMCVLYKKNKYISKAGRLFIEELKELFYK